MLAAGQWYRPFNFPLTPLLFLSIPLGLNLRKLSYHNIGNFLPMQW